MPTVLVAAAFYQFAFAAWTFLWPNLGFDWAGIPRPNHPLLWRAAGWISAIFGVAMLIAARSPIRHWPLVLLGFAKANLGLALILAAITSGELPSRALWIVVIDDLLWWFPFAAILWSALQAHAGRPPVGDIPMGIAEACSSYHLSSGETLEEASREQMVALVFLRHFGCTFTRRILRHLEDLKVDADRRGARLVLVHMLQQGHETRYLGQRSGVARIADPHCELYRAFGLGKGGIPELFGPRVWLPVLSSLVRGCGMGHLAGDGLQMPGAFLIHKGRILATQKPRSQAYLPDLPRLFEGLPSPDSPEKVPA